MFAVEFSKSNSHGPVAAKFAIVTSNLITLFGAGTVELSPLITKHTTS